MNNLVINLVCKIFHNCFSSQNTRKSITHDQFYLSYFVKRATIINLLDMICFYNLKVTSNQYNGLLSMKSSYIYISQEHLLSKKICVFIIIAAQNDVKICYKHYL